MRLIIKHTDVYCDIVVRSDLKIVYINDLVDQARWQSGYAAACKAADAGSIPTLASNQLPIARVAELVDATDLKSVVRKDVPVRVRPRAP